MAENQDGQEKSQDPTAKRIADAREKGQVPRSRELNTAAMTLMGLATVMMLGPYFTENFHTLFNEQFALKREDIFDPNAMLAHLTKAIGDALFMLLPYFGVMIVVAVASSIALGGFNMSTQALQPKFSKLDPIKGMAKLFSVRGLVELIKSLAKFVLVAAATVALLYAWSNDIIRLGDLNVDQSLMQAMKMVGGASLLLSSTLILMALIDVPFQMRQYVKDLKMTQQEVREELKQTEGKPEVKSRIRRLQMEMAVRRMMQEVPNADVIVTNPTHYAVALRYDPDKMRAPIVIAKGKELIAANIREIGQANRVPLVEAPMLARAIYFSTELQHPIPGPLFLAVAQLLAYVFQLRAYREQGGDIPTPPQSYPVPEEYQHD